MNWFDLTLLAIVALALIWGLRSGLIGATVAIGGTVVGLYLAPRISAPIADRLADTVGIASVATVIAYIAVFLAIVVGAYVAGRVLRRVLRLLLLGWADTLAGALLGLVAGVLIGFASMALLARLAFLIPQEAEPMTPLAVLETREKLVATLTSSALVPQYLKLRKALPGQALGMIPASFGRAMDELERRRAEAA